MCDLRPIIGDTERSRRIALPRIVSSENEKNTCCGKNLVEVDRGKAPPELYTQKYKNLPTSGLLIEGTMISPDQVRTLIGQERAKFKGKHDMSVISRLQAYAQLFPDSKWLSQSERE